VRHKIKHLKQSTLWDIHELYMKATDNYMDGFTLWRYKQDLWLLKYHVDELLNKCSTFVGEKDWIDEVEKELHQIKVWDKLKEK